MPRQTSGSSRDGSLPKDHVLLQKQTVGDVLDFWADLHPQHPAITFLQDRGAPLSLSYGELRAEALRIAAALHETCQAGDRVIMLFPPGAEFVAAFFGCLYAGVLAVPATEPKPRRLNDRLSVVAADCTPTAVLCSAEIADRIEVSVVCPALADVPWIRVGSVTSASPATSTPNVTADENPAAPGLKVAEPVDGRSLAFLQYTSGSTRRPKGVAISHHNLLHNLEMIRVGFRQRFNFDSDASLLGVFWLPPYHDMGLIGGILTPLYLGGTTVLMSPASFLKRPERWLETISQYRALISGAPNFAYDLCVDRIGEDKRHSLDLSHWEIAFCGAEPIRAATIDRFCERFEPQGFRRDSFYPCYGLAEATLLVSGNLQRQPPTIKRLRRGALENHRVEAGDSQSSTDTFRVVGCGQSMLDGEIMVVDPETRQPCPPDVIGEIWYRGESVPSEGYWNQPEETDAVFRANLADGGDKKYLRTGDMGFLADGQLFVTGRLKEMLVIRGRNLYPQDLEATAQASHPALAEAGAAFSVEIEGAEELVLIQEMNRQREQPDLNMLLHGVRIALAETYEIRPAAIVLVRPFSLPRTTSGKMQRLLCRQMYLRDQLNVVAKWAASGEPAKAIKATDDASEPVSANHASGGNLPELNGTERNGPAAHLAYVHDQRIANVRVNRAVEELEQWLCQRVAAYSSVAVEEVTPDRPLAELGLDSINAVQLVAEIEDRQNLTLNPIMMWNYPTARQLARYLVEQTMGAMPSAGPSEAEDSGRYAFADLLREVETLDDDQVQQRLALFSSGRSGKQRDNRVHGSLTP